VCFLVPFVTLGGKPVGRFACPTIIDNEPATGSIAQAS
jgi:hypothetical protein